MSVSKLGVICLLILTSSKADILSLKRKDPPFAQKTDNEIPLPIEGKISVATNQSRGGKDTQDGIRREEKSSFKKIENETILVIEGDFAYKSPEGLPISVKYIADENGNRASFKIGSGSSSLSKKIAGENKKFVNGNPEDNNKNEAGYSEKNGTNKENGIVSVSSSTKKSGEDKTYLPPSS